MKRQLTLSAVVLVLMLAVGLTAQLQQSGGGGSSVTIGSALPAGSNLVGGVNVIDSAGTNKLAVDSSGRVTVASLVNALPAGSNAIGSITNTAFGVSAGSPVMGYVRQIPTGCFAQSTASNLTASQVATSAGTSLTSTTSCVASCYINNITNSAVTLRLQDKSGTPIIWVGGNNDFSIPANSNTRVPLADGVVFTSGMTAIAGTTTALNLSCSVYQ
jgi:hypothetical protein